MAKKVSEIISHIAGRDIRPLVLKPGDVADAFGQLKMIGIDVSDRVVAEMMAGMGLDAAPDLQPLVGLANVGAPLQFLQAWLPGFVAIATAARKIDEIVGVTTVGSWEDEEIVQGAIEPVGLAQAYGDHNNIPLASWNVNFERRSIVRFEQGISVGILEEARTAKMRVNTSAQKRNAASLALDILRNRIGFYGWNGGAGRTYGYLNDPNEPAYTNFPNGASASPLWSTKTFLEITADIRLMTAALRTQSQDLIDPEKDATTLTLATATIEYLTVTSDFGISVRQWIKETYPAMRIVSAPELNGANGGANVAYLQAEKVTDGMSDDGGQVWLQMVPTRFMTLGVEKHAKNYIEDYSNATAGVMLKRPYALVRKSGN